MLSPTDEKPVSLAFWFFLAERHRHLLNKELAYIQILMRRPHV
jgi:hypothetical protein